MSLRPLCRGDCKKQFTKAERIAFQQVPAPDRRRPWFWQIRIVLHDLDTCPDAAKWGLS